MFSLVVRDLDAVVVVVAAWHLGLASSLRFSSSRSFWIRFSGGVQDIQTTTKKKAENQIDAERLRTMAEKKAEN
ncbi:hypothetical protein Q3G72_021627 [Acer saccharum]|nr:hypothetical protein Q3G72_021627 [Acer saccharum]